MPATASSITATDLAARIARGEATVLLDVRTPAEYRECRIAGARLEPLRGLDAERFAGEHTTEAACVVICRSGVRAADAARQLVAAGMSRVWVLEGGMLSWETAGLPVQQAERGWMPLEQQARIANGLWILLGWALGM